MSKRHRKGQNKPKIESWTIIQKKKKKNSNFQICPEKKAQKKISKKAVILMRLTAN
jgi:hypothetical protein